MTRGTWPHNTRYGVLTRSDLPPMGGLSTVALSAFVLLGPLRYLRVFNDFNQIPPTASSALALLAVAGAVLGPRDRVLRAPVSIPALLLVIWSAGSVMWSIDTTSSSLAIRTSIALVSGLMIAAMVMPMELYFAWLLRSFKLGIAASVAAVALVPSTRTTADSAQEGWSAFFLAKNGLGTYCCLAFALIATMDRPGHRRNGWLVSCLVLIAGSRSVTAQATVVSSIAMLWWIKRFVTLDSRLGTGFLTATFAAASAIMTVAFFSATLVVESLGKDLSISGRTTIWSSTVGAIRERPLHGYGINSLWNAVPGVVPKTRELWTEIGFNTSHSHNGALEMTLQLGLVGFGLYLAIFLGVASSASALLRTNPALGSWMILLLFNTFLISLSEIMTIHWLGVLVGAHITGMQARARQDPQLGGIQPPGEESASLAVASPARESPQGTAPVGARRGRSAVARSPSFSRYRAQR
jgi:exopolysaccharide production protein ExoQ